MKNLRKIIKEEIDDFDWFNQFDFQDNRRRFKKKTKNESRRT